MTDRIDAGKRIIGVIATAAVAFFLVAVPGVEPSHAGTSSFLPCGGDPIAPECDGSCPDGLRCTQVENVTVVIVVTDGQNATAPSERAGSSNGCACLEVLCGGESLDLGQGCCNGVPFTIGEQGCCRGEVIGATETCDCPYPIDFPSEICCGPGFDSTATVPSSGLSASLFACCENAGSAASYTLNSGVDCCPGSSSTLCLGKCEGSECTQNDCCQCSGCDDEGLTCTSLGELPVAPAPGSSPAGAPLQDGSVQNFGCAVACSLAGCDPSGARVPDASCGESGCETHTPTATATATATPTDTPIPQGGSCDPADSDCAAGLVCSDEVCCDRDCDAPDEFCNLPGQEGTCTAVTAPAPAASRTGLLIALIGLVGVGAFALLRRREIRHHFWSL
jgi:MYXO-CTERM domain-containing protein